MLILRLPCFMQDSTLLATHSGSPDGLEEVSFYVVNCLWEGSFGRELQVTSRTFGGSPANS